MVKGVPSAAEVSPGPEDWTTVTPEDTACAKSAGTGIASTKTNSTAFVLFPFRNTSVLSPVKRISLVFTHHLTLRTLELRIAKDFDGERLIYVYPFLASHT